MRAVEDESRWLKALVYGKSGTGKTGFGASAPDPLILLSEKQGVPNVRDAARRLKLSPDFVRENVLIVETLQDYRDILRALQADRSQPFVVKSGDKVVYTRKSFPTSVVIDSLTDAMNLVQEEIRLQSPQKTGKDGLPVDSERFWNVLMDRASKLVRAFRDVDANVIFLCLLDDRTTGEGDQAVRSVGPSLPMRRLPEVVMASVNVVGITYRAKKGDVYEWGIRTMGPDEYLLKPFPPLQKNEVTNFTSWCTRIAGIDDGQRVSGPDGEAAGMAPIVAPAAIAAIAASVATPTPTPTPQEKPPQPEPEPEPVSVVAAAVADIAKTTTNKKTSKTDAPSVSKEA